MKQAWTTFSFRLNTALLARLRAAAAREDSNVGELIRRAVVTELDRLAVERLARELEERAVS